MITSTVELRCKLRRKPLFLAYKNLISGRPLCASHSLANDNRYVLKHANWFRCCRWFCLSFLFAISFIGFLSLYFDIFYQLLFRLYLLCSHKLQITGALYSRFEVCVICNVDSVLLFLSHFSINIHRHRLGGTVHVHALQWLHRTTATTKTITTIVNLYLSP